MLATATLLLLTLFSQDDKPLEKGPIHEGYAQPFEARPVLGPLLKNKPPEPLQEVPPEDRPKGKDIRWMSGYWQWDEERIDYIWVSGFWRQIPPGKDWTPGRFEPLDGQWRWIPGYWKDQNQPEEEFVEESPPAIPEVGPSIPAPSPQMVWASGYWVRQGPRWGWRPGTWITHRPGWVWHPGRWAFSRFGFTFVPGYWDYALEYRGLLYSPVYYSPIVYNRPGFFHRPRFVVCYEDLPCGLFYRQGYGTYFYGDYFRPNYAGLGFTFWVGTRGIGPDPLYSYYRHNHNDRWVIDMDNYRRERFAGRQAVAPVINTTVVNVNNIKNITNINNKSIVNNTTNNRQGIVAGPGSTVNAGLNSGGQTGTERKTGQVRVIEASKQSPVVLASGHPIPSAKDIPESQIPPRGQGTFRPKEARDRPANILDRSGMGVAEKTPLGQPVPLIPKSGQPGSNQAISGQTKIGQQKLETPPAAGLKGKDRPSQVAVPIKNGITPPTTNSSPGPVTKPATEGIRGAAPAPTKIQPVSAPPKEPMIQTGGGSKTSTPPSAPQQSGQTGGPQRGVTPPNQNFVGPPPPPAPNQPQVSGPSKPSSKAGKSGDDKKSGESKKPH